MDRTGARAQIVNQSTRTCVGYFCHHCGATNCKLWREFKRQQPDDPSPIVLLCAECAAANQQKSIADIDAAGFRTDPDLPGLKTELIGVFVPAITDDEGGGFWGYTAVPHHRVKWWRGLRTLPANREVL